MATCPPRKGFADKKDCTEGWIDKVGNTFRMGPNVFVLVAHKKWGSIPAGKIPARLYRAFKYKGDRLGLFRLDAEYSRGA